MKYLMKLWFEYKTWRKMRRLRKEDPFIYEE